MECLDGCTSSFDSDLCIRCLYNRIHQVLDDLPPEVARNVWVAQPHKHLWMHAEEAADVAFDHLDRDYMHAVLAQVQRR